MNVKISIQKYKQGALIPDLRTIPCMRQRNPKVFIKTYKQSIPLYNVDLTSTLSICETQT